MNGSSGRIAGVIAIGSTWALFWAALFAAMAFIIGLIRPQEIDAGEGPAAVFQIGWVIGMVSGMAFGVILGFAENHRAPSELSLLRVAAWGLVAGAVWPLLTPVDDSMALVSSLIGTVCASVLVALARWTALRSGPAGWLGRLLLVSPLELACASGPH